MIDDIYNKWYYSFSRYAGVAELADAPDLGSGALRRGGSSPFSRTNYICTCRCFFFAHLHLFKETGVFLGSIINVGVTPLRCHFQHYFFAKK